MMEKCASPDCDKEFRYFREGRLFRCELLTESSGTSDGPKAIKKTETFWLCGACSLSFDLVVRNSEVQLVPARNGLKKACADECAPQALLA